MASLYEPSNTTAINSHRDAAASLQAAILDLFWDSNKVCCAYLPLLRNLKV